MKDEFNPSSKRSRSPIERRRSRSKDRRERRDRDRHDRDRHERERHERERHDRDRHDRDRRDRDHDKHRKSSSKSKKEKRRGRTEAINLESCRGIDEDMMKMMGFGNFDTTKNKKVQGNVDGTVKINKPRKYRQYMNRKGGFNRPLDYVA